MNEYISSFIYCDNIQMEMTPQGPKPQIINPLQMLVPIAIPSNYSFAISCNISGFDATKENFIRIKFVAPNEEILYDSENINFQIPSDQIAQNILGTMQFNLDMRNIVFKELGLYTTEIYVNSYLLGKHKIQVLAGGAK